MLTKKVIFYWEGNSKGGSEVILDQIINFSHKSNLNIALANCSSTVPKLGEKWKLNNVRFYHLEMDHQPSKSSITAENAQFDNWWYHILEIEQPDVIVSNNGGYPWHTTCLNVVVNSKKKGIKKIILIVHSSPEEITEGNKEKIKDQKITNACNHIVVGGKKLLSLMKKSRPTLSDKLTLLEYGVESFYRESNQRVDPSIVRLGMAAEMRNSNKGQMVLLEALKKLYQENQNWICKIAGSGPYLNFFRSESKLSSLPIYFLGKLSKLEMIKFYNSLDIYILPSFQEGLSLTILEAMSAKLPIITTDVGAHSDVIKDGVTGYLIPPNNSDDLIIALRNMICNPKLRQSFGKAGNDIYLKNHSLKKYLDGWMDLIQGPKNEF